jgi:hypothetical protein
MSSSLNAEKSADSDYVFISAKIILNKAEMQEILAKK